MNRKTDDLPMTREQCLRLRGLRKRARLTLVVFVLFADMERKGELD